MYGGLARFVVKAGKRDEFLELLRWDAQGWTMVIPFGVSVTSNADQ